MRSLFAGTGVTFAFARGTTPWELASAEQFVSFMETNYGPLVMARERLSGEGTWADCRAQIVAMAERRNEAVDGRLLMQAEYLVAVGER